jgi:subtilase family serine protease
MNHLPQLNSSSFRIFYPVGPFAAPPFPDMETTLDVEWAHAAAPKANIVLLLVPDLLYTELQEAVLYAISNGFGNNISNSYGSPEVFTDPGDMIIWNTLGELAASLGMSMNFSSGDHGDNAVAFGTASPDAPSNSPFVTSVGGTSVALIGKGNNHIKFQTGWGNNATQMTFLGDGSPIDPPSTDGFVYGAGGGESQFFVKPAWQRNLPGAGRQQPDVSAVADPFTGVEIVLTQNGQLTVGTIGGTSVACPFFSGIWAIANQKAGHPLGLAGPSLYNLPVNAFYDVRPYSSATNVTGTVSNTRGATHYSAAQLAGPLESSRKFYSAFWDFGLGAFYNLTFGTDSSLTTSAGWDNVTGMGTPNGLAFIRAVAK